MEGKYEFLDIGNGFGSGTLRLSYTLPLGAKDDYSLRARLPVTHVDVLGNDNHDIGDFSLRLAHVFGLSKKSAFVAQGEMVLDTARRDELGMGQNFFKGTLIVARFLKGGAIFAPAIVQSNSLWGDSERADVNTTTFDFYYVPKFENPRYLATIDGQIARSAVRRQRRGLHQTSPVRWE